jgi:hypothetical protein
MFEVTDACQHHAYSMGIAVVNAVLVLDRAPRLYHCGDTCFMGDGNAVWEGEEGIGGHDSTFQVEAKLIGLSYGLS